MNRLYSSKRKLAQKLANIISYRYECRLNAGLRFWITRETVEEWASGKNLFFILAIGRSGTEFLASLLNQADGCLVYHEPVREDFYQYQRAFHNRREAIRYIEKYRKKEIYIRGSKYKAHTYGEVNSLLRRHTEGLQKAFPNATFIHLVRDGRDVVRSMMARNTMTPSDRNTSEIYPAEWDPFSQRWGDASRFEKLCWYWKTENEYLDSYIDGKVRLEDVSNSYESFYRQILRPLGLSLPEGTWRSLASIPKNRTKNYVFPHWTEWSSSKRQAFYEICASEMEKYGYNLSEF